MEQDKAPTSNEIDNMLQQLEQRIDTLKRRYERFFMGLEDRPPNAMRKQVVREVHEAENTHITNTAQKFKLRSIVQKFNTNKTRWNRIMRQIEKGTYHRDRKRAERRRGGGNKTEETDRDDKKDDVVEIDPDDDHIEDLEEMDLDQVFDNSGSDQNRRSRASATDSSDGRSPEEKERIKQKRLAEIQKKLGLNGDENNSRQDASPTQQQRQNSGSNPRQRRGKSGQNASNASQKPRSSGNSGSRQPRKSASNSRRNSSRKSGSDNTSSDDNAGRNKKLQQVRDRLDKSKSSSSSSSKKRGKSKKSSRKSSDDKSSKRKEKLQKLKRNLDRTKDKSSKNSNSSRDSSSSSRKKKGNRRVVRRDGDDS